MTEPDQDETDARKRVVFLCYGNACRSQMAEAYARALGADVMVAVSAGLRPVGFVPKEVAVVMEEEGISTEGHHSKPLQDVSTGADLIVDLAGLLNPKLVRIPVSTRPVVDPFGGDLADYRKTRRAVLREVTSLIEELRRGRG